VSALLLAPDAPPFAAHHVEIRADTRSWVRTHVTPYADGWEQAGRFPAELVGSAGTAGLLGWKHPPVWGGRGVDLLADAIVTEELARGGSGGVAAALGACKDLAAYYVARFGTDDQRGRWLPPAVRGETVAALAVTEPGAGSDVAGLACRAEAQPDGAWRLSGTKVFITNGARADWVLVAARTGAGGGWRDLSLFVVPTTAPGFAASRIPTLGWRTSQTGLLSLDGVEVEADQLLGEPGSGFVMIMRSFQWERMSLALGAVATAALDLEAAMPWVRRGDRAGFSDLLRRVLAQRAFVYALLERVVAGEEPVGLVAGAKWGACDLAVETALFRLGLARRHGEGSEVERADRALRDARLGPIGGGAREVMAELVARTLDLHSGPVRAG
jgi:acyl-CoA dehydrogenase